MSLQLPQPVRCHPVLFSFLWGATCAAAAMTVATFATGIGPPDPDGFGQIARAVYEGRGFAYASPAGPVPAYERGPIYPLLVAVLMQATGGFALWKVLILHALLHGGSTVLVHRLGARVLPIRFSLLAALLVGLHPLLLWYALRIWSEPLQAFLLLWVVDSVVRLDSRNSCRTAIELGLACALAVLTKSVVLFLPFLLILVRTSIGFRVSLRHALVILVVFLSCVGVWMARSYYERGTVTFIHTGLGFNLIQGNQIARSFPLLPVSSTTNWAEGRAHVESLLTGRGGNGFEPANDIYLMRIAVRERVDSPAFGIGGIAVNALTFWYLAETPIKSVVAGCLQLPLFFLTILHARRLWASQLVNRVALIALFYMWVVHALVVGWVRYSAPVIPLLVLVAISGLVQTIGRFSRSRPS